MDEWEAIGRFTGRFRGGAGLRLGPGDDCALLAPTPGRDLCATTDAVVEGVHFGPAFTPEEVGHKALAVNLSDLAAMGARPRWFLVAIALPAGPHPRLVDGLARGMAALARRFSCVLAGGNFSRGPGLAVTVTALGEVAAGTALRRDGLAPGHLLAVTGTLGAAALALQRARPGRAQRRPEPRVAAGLAARAIARAAIDLSDGLAGDLRHMCAASGCGAEVWEDRLPMARGVRGRPDALDLCLSGGEDYELLFGVAEHDWPQLRRRVAATGTPIALIGRATTGGLRLARAEGAAARPLPAGGFSHF